MRPDPRLDHMRGDLGGHAWPPIFSARVAPLAAALLQFDRSQWLAADAIEAGQRRQLAQLAVHFATHSPWFCDRLERTGLVAEDLGKPGALAELPAIHRREAQAQFAAQHVTALPPGHTPVHKVNTSGSTGEPVIVWKTAANQLHWLALTMRYHLWHEQDFTGRLAVIRALLPQYGLSKQWGAPISSLFPTGQALRIDIETDLPKQLDQLIAFAPTSLIVYPSNLDALLDEMDRRGASLPSLKRVRTLGETLSPALRGRAAARLGATVRDCFSTEELGYVAIECEAGALHVNSETVIVELLGEDGRPVEGDTPGRVVVTDLHNHATPLFRYETGDYAQWGRPCGCGRTLPVIGRILGRQRNMIVKPDGQRHWPLTGYKQFREVAPVLQYQYVQHAPDHIEVRLVTERPMTAGEEEALRDLIRKKLRQPFRIDFTYFEDRLPLGRNGKFEEFLSLVK